MEKCTLTREQIERAERREGPKHPVVTVLRSRRTEIDYHHAKLAGLDYPGPWQDYVRSKFGFLADALEQETGDFQLGPLDIVSIWSYALETDFKPRYSLAGMIGNSYAAIGNGELWKGLPRYSHERGKYPVKLKEDPEGIKSFRSRLSAIDSSLKELRFYSDGTNEKPFDLVRKEARGDQEAAKKLKALEEHRNAHKSAVLEVIQENWANGFYILFGILQELTE